MRERIRIKTICEGGYGGQAKAIVQLRNYFPGLGGPIITKQDLEVAYRLPKNIKEYDEIEKDLDLSNETAQHAANTFLRHVLVKKLDDLFFRRQQYYYSHIPRPLGSTSKGGYLYEWIYGNEGWVTEYIDIETYNWCSVQVDDMFEVSGAFHSAGVGIFDDIIDAEDGRYTKNIIVEQPNINSLPEHISLMWKRIDFGSESLNIKFDKFEQFLKDNDSDCKKFLSLTRIKMIKYIIEYLAECKKPQTFKKWNELCRLVKIYRRSSASHMGVEGLSPSQYFPRRIVSISSKKRFNRAKDISYKQLISEKQTYNVYLEVRQSFPGIDGIIYTVQQLPVAKTSRTKFEDGKNGFTFFLQQFLIKKLEDAFISQQKYYYPHIPRPLGSQGPVYFYEWSLGKNYCNPNLLKRQNPSKKGKGLYDWFEFCLYFEEAGINMSEISLTNQGFVNEIVIKQPNISINKMEYISQIWQRIFTHEESITINLDKLKKYLQIHKQWLMHHLKNQRYYTMLLAVKYLKGERIDFPHLVEGIHDYRLSTMRHVNYQGFEPLKISPKDVICR